MPYPSGYPGGYPGPLPPLASDVPRTRARSRWTEVVVGARRALAVVGALVAGALLIGLGRLGSGSAGFTDAAAKTAIQNYLRGPPCRPRTARPSRCATTFVHVRRPQGAQVGQVALARLGSDAFRKQFSQAEVTSIDKIAGLVLSGPGAVHHEGDADQHPQ